MSKPGQFFDKHDDKSNVDDRNRYLAEKLEEDKLTWRRLPNMEKIELEVHLKELADGAVESRPFLELVNDESACNANDKISHQYVERGKAAFIRAKSRGAGLMVGAYITEIGGGVLEFNGKLAAATLEYGNGNWWNSEKMIAHLKEVIALRLAKYPWARVIWRFCQGRRRTERLSNEHWARWQAAHYA